MPHHLLRCLPGCRPCPSLGWEARHAQAVSHASLPCLEFSLGQARASAPLPQPHASQPGPCYTGLEHSYRLTSLGSPSHAASWAWARLSLSCLSASPRLRFLAQAGPFWEGLPVMAWGGSWHKVWAGVCSFTEGRLSTLFSSQSYQNEKNTLVHSKVHTP